MIEAKLYDSFFQDSGEFIRSLYSTLNELEKRGIQGDLVDHAFRAVHSVKSEAAYLGFDEITGICDGLEGILEGMKLMTDTEPASAGVNERLEALRSGLNDLEGSIEAAKRDGMHTGSHEERVVIGESASGEVNGLFSEFERQLAEEAYERGETLYRLYCEIDESETMLYPRMFLLINNLELEANVIKTIPELSDPDVAANEFQVYFSTSLNEDQISKIVTIDQIVRVQLTCLDYREMLSGQSPSVSGEKPAAPQVESTLLRVDSRKFEELKNGIEEIELHTRHLQSGFRSNGSVDPSSLSQLMELSEHVGIVIQKMYLVSAGEELERLRSFAVDMAEKLNKKIDVFVKGGDFEIDTRFLDILSDVLVHLVRNAVDHGIETPEERRMMQKEESGKILISGSKTEKGAVFQILDDGKGIEPEEISEHASRSGITIQENGRQNLIDILAHPGFTTKTVPTLSSGRGYGLDLVVRNLREVPKAAIRVASSPGKGTIFTIILPLAYTNISIVIARSGDLQLAFQKSYVRKIEQIDTSALYSGEGGGALYRGIPLFTPRGRLRSTGGIKEKYAVLLTYLDSEGYVLVDEVLFEKEIFEKQIDKTEQPEPHLHRIRFGKTENEFLFVSPALILNV